MERGPHGIVVGPTMYTRVSTSTWMLEYSWWIIIGNYFVAGSTKSTRQWTMDIYTCISHSRFLIIIVFLKPIKNLWLSTYWGVLLLRSGCTENLPKRESMRGPGGHVGLTRNCTAVLSWAWDDSTNILPQTCGESTICTMLSLSLSCLHHVHLPSALWLMPYTSRVFVTLCGGIMIYDWKVILS